MLFHKYLRRVFLFCICLSLMVSCRLGEVLSEADPETNTEYDPAEKEEIDSIVPHKNLENNQLKEEE